MRNKYTFIVVSLLILVLTLSGCSKATTAGSKVNDKLELAIKYLADSKYEEAVLAFQEVIKIEPKSPEAYKGLSIAYSLQGQQDKAEQALQDGLKQTPSNEALQIATAGLLEDEGKTDQAEVAYKNLASSNPAYIKYYTDDLIRHGKASQAISFLEAGTNMDKYEFNNLLARAYFENDQKDKALDLITKSLGSDLNQVWAYTLLKKDYQDKWDELLTLSDQYSKQSQTIESQIMRMIALNQEDKYKDSISVYEKLPDQLKESIIVQELAATALFKQGNKERGINVLKQIKTETIKDAAVLASIADVYLLSGDQETARKLANQGIAINNLDMENYVVLYKSYLGENDSVAKTWIAKFLLNSPYGLTQTKVLLSEAGINGLFGDQADKVMDDFFNAKTLHLKSKLEYLTRNDDETNFGPEDVETWVKGNKIRRDYYTNGKLDRTLMSIDNEKSMFFKYKTKKKEVAVVDTQYYLDEFRSPANTAKYLGKDQESKGDLFKQDLQKTYQIKGAPNGDYEDSRIVCVGNGRILYLKEKSHTINEQGGVDKEEETLETIQFSEVNKNIDDNIFAPPF